MQRYPSELGDYGKMWFEPAPLLKSLAEKGAKFNRG
jgi:3-hydroxyacyl-CoA dehydrogenase